MGESDVKIQYILKFYYKKGKICDISGKKNCDVYEPNAVSIRVARNWFKRLQSGNFDVKDEPRSGRPVTDKVDAILEKVEQDRHINSYDIAEELWMDVKTVLSHLRKPRYTKKLNT
ncbi:Histone-lysine N-methyltransferase SETMAR [Eumeta japonica]|uniref:Histone-lysine N-methyltransferase SETMAR n=1 Tax=Eumeta variegata TaxID=151549 RepID=A0A4C2A3H0_EUMVA|nr:Histone-lysine N-methyltransferase SETMAR [Eumeta japonica]